MNAGSTTHPRPIHRWKTFWLGILVLTFIAWAWLDSTRFASTLHFRDYSLSHAGSGVCLTKWGPYRGTTPHPLTWAREPIPSTDYPWPHARLEPPAIHHMLGDRSIFDGYLEDDPAQPGIYRARSSAAVHFGAIMIQDSRALYLPHWLLILTFLIPWLALLLWRHQRIKRSSAGCAGRWPAEFSNRSSP